MPKIKGKNVCLKPVCSIAWLGVMASSISMPVNAAALVAKTDAYILFNKHDYHAAINVLADSNLSDDALLMKAESFYRLNSFYEAKKYYQQLAEQSKDKTYKLKVSVRLFDVEIGLNNLAGAQSAYQNYVEAYKKAPGQMSYSLGKASLDAGLKDEAAVLLEKVPVADEFYMRARFILAGLNKDKKSRKSLISLFKKIEKIKPITVEDHSVVELARLAMARIYADSGRDDLAEKAYMSVSLNTEHGDVATAEWVRVLLARYEAGHEPSKSLSQALTAIERYRKVHEINTQKPELLTLSAYILGKSKRYSESELAYDQLLNYYRDLSSKLVQSGENPQLWSAFSFNNIASEQSVIPGLPSYFTDGLPEIAEIIAMRESLDKNKEKILKLEEQAELLEQDSGAKSLSIIKSNQQNLLSEYKSIVVAKQNQVAKQVANKINIALAEAEYKRAEIILAQMQDLKQQLSIAREFQAEKIDLFDKNLSTELKLATTSLEQQSKTINLKPEPRSDDLEAMQAIEPGFIPKDERTYELFALQRKVSENEKFLKENEEQSKNIAPKIEKRFRDELAKITLEKTVNTEDEYEKSLTKLINSYEIALKNNPEHPVYAQDALYYLGNYYFDIDEKKYFDSLAKYNDAREQGRDDVAYPEENFSRTIDSYEKLLEKYPDYRHKDGVLYLLALAFWYEGAFSNAVENFQTIITKYTNSKYVEEVRFRLGEYHYDMDDYDDAIESYSLVAKNQKSRFYDKAIYKIAWAHFQKNRYALAIDNFVHVLEFTKKDSAEDAGSGMRAEVLRYIVKSFAEQILEEEQLRSKQKIGKSSRDEEKEYAERLGLKLVDRVYAHFTKDGQVSPFLKELLMESASQLLDESKSEGAILAFRKVIELDKNHEDNPRLHGQIVDILTEAGKLEEARKESLELISHYNKNSAWYLAMSQNILAQRYAENAVRDAILALGVYYHKRAKEFSDSGKIDEANLNFEEASSYYARYLREYPERDDTHKAIFYLAESAYERKDYEMALRAYDLLKEYLLPMPDDLRRDATFNIVFTFRYVLENEAKNNRFKDVDFDALTSKSRGLEKEEIPELGKRYLISIDEFLKIAPNDAQVPVLLFHAAAIYYVYGQTDEAYGRFSFIIDTYAETPPALIAGRLIIDDAVANGDWERVVQIAKRYKDQNLGGQKDDFARMEGTGRFKMARAVFEEANELHKNNMLAESKAKYKESAELFQNLLKEDPRNPFADLMLFNAARAIVQSGTTTQALPLYKQLYTDYPNSEHAQTARFQEALALEKMLKFSDAAKSYDGIIKQDPKSEGAGNAMLNKALLYEAAGDLVAANQAFLEFAKTYPNRSEAPDALLATAMMYKKSGKISQQIAILEQFIKQYKKDPEKIMAIIEAHVHIADSYLDLGKTTQAMDYYKRAVALYSPQLASPIAAFYAAKAQLALEKAESDSFKKMLINAKSSKAQGEQLTAMMKKLTVLTQNNEAIIKKYAQPVWNAESMRRIGAIYEHLATSMLKAPCPRDVQVVDEYACDEYTVLLEDKAAILEDKALQAYKQAYDIVLSAYDAPAELVENIQVALNRMRPGEYQRVGDVIQKPKSGEFFGQSRMLSTGKMASSLHPKEPDPDISKKTVIEEEKLPGSDLDESPEGLE